MGKTEAQIPIHKIAAGNTIKIKGEINENAKRFSIDFSDIIHGEVLLNIHVDFKVKEIIRNSELEKDAGWGTKETEGGFVFQPSTKFEIEIVIEAPYFNISIDTKPYCTFTHRAPYSKINLLKISGDITLEEVSLEDTIYKSNKPGAPLVKYQSATSRPSDAAGPSTIPTLAPVASASSGNLAPAAATHNLKDQPASEASVANVPPTSPSGLKIMSTKSLTNMDSTINPVQTQKSRTSISLNRASELNPRSELSMPVSQSMQELKSRGPTSISQLARRTSNGSLKEGASKPTVIPPPSRSQHNQSTGCCRIT